MTRSWTAGSGRVPAGWRGGARRALDDLRRAVAGADYPPVRRKPRPPGSRRRARLARYGRAVVWLALLGLTAITVQFLIEVRQLNTVAAWILALLTVAPLVLVGQRPLWAWRVTLLGLFLGTFEKAAREFWPWSPTQILVALAILVAVSFRADRSALVWIGGLTVLPVLIFVNRGAQIPTTVLVVVILVLGATLRRVRQVQGELAEQAEVTEREQARREALEERARIAREMHDVVAHHMSLLAVRAETAPYRLPGMPEPVRDEFTALAGAARDALTDMRRLLGVLRSDGGDAERSPQPDLTAVADLVEAARQAGLTVDYVPPVGATGLRPPAAVALAGVRIVQEALANAVRHAPGAPVTVRVRPGSRELAVRVLNGRPATPARPSGGGQGGLGVTGMRERAELLGGDFTAEPTPEGGFLVTATLPYHGGEPDGGRATGAHPAAAGVLPGGDRPRPAPGDHRQPSGTPDHDGTPDNDGTPTTTAPPIAKVPPSGTVPATAGDGAGGRRSDDPSPGRRRPGDGA